MILSAEYPLFPLYRMYHCPRASMKRMFSLIITQLCGALGGKIINGATNAANRLLKIVIAQAWLELRLLKHQQI
jgi:hypothetical protein